MRSLIAAACIAAAASASTLHEGPCPSYFQANKAGNFDSAELTGLWYEYLWDKQYDDGFDYKCSMWTVLSDDDNSYVAFNHIHYTKEDGMFARLDMNFSDLTSPAITYNRLQAHKPDAEAADRQMQIRFTDYYSHMIGQSCVPVSEQQHRMDWFVWVREKQPAMFVRNKMREYLLAQEGLNDQAIADMTKSTLVDCWEKDLRS